MWLPPPLVNFSPSRLSFLTLSVLSACIIFIIRYTAFLKFCLCFRNIYIYEKTWENDIIYIYLPADLSLFPSSLCDVYYDCWSVS